MADFFWAVLNGIGTFFMASGGQGFSGQEQRPVSFWAARLAVVALFFGVVAGIWLLYFSAFLKP